MPDSLIYFFIDFLEFKNIKFLVAPHEADFQLASMYKNNVIDYIWSEDSDILVYDCTNIVKGLKLNGDCFLINKTILQNFKNKLKKGLFKEELTKKLKAKKFFDLSPNDKMKVAVYSGCDYLDSVRGFGFGTVIDYIPEDEKSLLDKIKK